MPTGAGDLIGLAPAVLEALDRYMKSPPAGLLEFGFRPARAIRRGLHLFKQILKTLALPRARREESWDIAELAEVRRAKFGLRALFADYGRQGDRRFPCWHGRQ